MTRSTVLQVRTLLLFAAVAVASAPSSAQDSVALTDGRFVFGPPMTRKPEGVVVHYGAGDVLIPKEMVKEASTSKTEGLPEEAPPPGSEEKIKAGFVRFEGNWIKPEQRDKTIEARRAARAKKIKEAKDRREWRNRGKYETQNFRFEYTIDPDVVKRYAELMETYFKVFTKEWGISKPPKEGKMLVCFYHDRETFEQVGGAGGGVIGYYRFRDPRELNFFYDRLDERLTIDVMFHETNHYLTHLIDLKFGYPPWINESLAEYYGASEWDAKTKSMKTGALQDGRLAVLQGKIFDGEWQKLEGLMDLKHGEFNADHYAWGWSFVHYLLSTPKYASKFKAFYKSLASDPQIKRVDFGGGMKTVEGAEVKAAFKRYVGVKDLGALEKEWHDYVKGLQQSSPRGYAEAGDLYYGQGLYLKATRYYQTAIEKGHATASTYYGLARCHRRKSKTDEAAEALKKAIEKDPLNGTFYVELAETNGLRSGEEPSEEAVKLCKLALEVDPDNSDVYFALWRFDALRKLLDESSKN